MPSLFVHLAARVPRAVILRRGPSAWYHAILWHTDKDMFEHGAWFRGRLYEDRCDLAPDGELFAYFALQGSRYGTTYRGTWTAVSRPPWLDALALWPQGDTWGGGARFIADRTIVLASSSCECHTDHREVELQVSLGPVPPKPRCTSESDADWSGYDHNGRVIFTRGGRLFRVAGQQPVEVADFTNLVPDPRAAPAAADTARRRKRT